MQFSFFLLQAAGGSGISSMILFGGMILIFWLFMIRPQAKQQREQRDFMQNLAKGDQVVTTSGIVGKVNKIEDNIVTIEAGKVYLPFLRSAISKQMTDALVKDEDKA